MDSQYIIDLCKRSHENARDHGFVEDGKPQPFYRDFNLFLSETAEALEDFRNGKKIDEVWYEYKHDNLNVLKFTTRETAFPDPNDERRNLCKPCGIPSELADVVIRICQRCGTEGSEEKLATEAARTSFDSVSMTKDFEEMLAWVNVRLSKAFVQRWWNIEASNHLSFIGLAEALFLIFSFCEQADIDLKAVIAEKEAYNRTRPHKHGGKAF